MARLTDDRTAALIGRVAVLEELVVTLLERADQKEHRINFLEDLVAQPEGAEPYKRDLKNLEFHLLDTGHFALEEDGDLIPKYNGDFLAKHVRGA